MQNIALERQKAELLKDIVYAANDGIITTFAVVAGVEGGGLAAVTILVLGFANLFADGFSMAVSNYLGTESEKEFLEAERIKDAKYENPRKNSIATFFAFVAAGVIPLLPFIGVLASAQSFFYSTIATLCAIFLLGALSSVFTKRNWFVSGFKMFSLGSLAAAIAYAVGFFMKTLLS